MEGKGRNTRKFAATFIILALLLADIVLAVKLLQKEEAHEDMPEGSAENNPGNGEEAENGSVLGESEAEGMGQTPGNEQGNADSTQSGEDSGKIPGDNGGEDEDSPESRARELLAGMTLEQKVAQLFMITPEALTGYARVTAAGEVTKQSFEQHPVGGIIYMADNLADPEQTRTMLANMARYSLEALGLPVFLGVDEEGGTVARVARNAAFGVENVGNMSEIGASGDCGVAYAAGSTIGGYLADLGFNLDFAPVADVWSNPENTVVKYRSFGSDALLVRDMVVEEITGLKEQGILSVAKHFPGHGSTTADSHKGAAVVNKTLQELKACDLIPFQGAVEAGVPFVMVGHLSLPQVLENDVPAVLSKEIIQDILREELAFDGIVITDALDMGAITDYYTSAEAAVLAIEAGADMLLMPEDFRAAYQGVLDAVRDGRLTEQRIDESVLRILRVKLELEE